MLQRASCCGSRQSDSHLHTTARMLPLLISFRAAPTGCCSTPSPSGSPTTRLAQFFSMAATQMARFGPGVALGGTRNVSGLSLRRWLAAGRPKATQPAGGSAARLGLSARTDVRRSAQVAVVSAPGCGAGHVCMTAVCMTQMRRQAAPAPLLSPPRLLVCAGPGRAARLSGAAAPPSLPTPETLPAWLAGDGGASRG